MRLGRFVQISVGILPFLLSVQAATQRSDVEIRAEQVERKNVNEARFRMAIENRSDREVFFAGVVIQNNSTVYPVYLEEQLPSGSWKTVVPCVDVPPPSVIKLEPRGSMIEYLTLKNPIQGACKDRTVDFERQFRFRLGYFETQKNAAEHLSNFFSAETGDPAMRTAVSAPFSIPRQAN